VAVSSGNEIFGRGCARVADSTHWHSGGWNEKVNVLHGLVFKSFYVMPEDERGTRALALALAAIKTVFSALHGQMQESGG
jgi:hypothetical protein